MDKHPRRPEHGHDKHKEPARGTPRRPAGSEMPAGSYISTSTLLCIIVFAVLAVSVILIFSRIITKSPEKVITVNTVQTVNPVTAEAEKALQAIKTDIENNFVKIKVGNDDTKAGNLVLVNNTHAYTFDPSPKLVNKPEQVAFVSNMTGNYVVSYPAAETLTREAMDAFNQMTDDFAVATGLKDLFLLDSYRTYEDQQRVYETKGSDIATLPGHSEHHTGLAFDLEIYRSGVISDFDGTGDYAWINQNCHKYGYILRYPEDKTHITDISYEPWHFRYVGKEHAYYMHANNLCLEEYIDILANYPADSARLNFTTDSGESYMIYSQAVSGNEAEIYVPKNYSYTLSGDNNGHVIVSCRTS